MPHATARRPIRITFWCLLLVALAAQPLLAQAPPSADTFVSSSTAKTNYGSAIALVVGPGTTSYVQFNLAGIPAGASISKATLRLYVDAVAKAGKFDVYQLNSSWAENTLTYNTPPPTLGASVTNGTGVSITTASWNQFLLIDITSLAQGWLNGTIPNNGVALALTSGSNGSFSFDSKESFLTGNGPELEIAFNSGTGPQGPAGPTGPQGPQGTTGAVGPTGATGATGSQGATGLQGAPGPLGPMGLTGAQGLQGVAGPQGAAGTGFNFRAAFDNTASYAANDVVSYNGSSYVAKNATNPGDPAPDSNSNWSLMAQQGAAGPAGAPGAQGPQGPLGPAGANGSAGAQGPQGAAGPQGPQGLPGSGGFTGIMEVNGSTDFTVPPGVNSLLVEAWGGGGGGATGLPGGTSNFILFSGPGGGGGGAGAYARAVVAVVPGTTYHITIGGGGAPGTLASENGVDGAATQITDLSANLLLSVAGGHGGSMGSLSSGSGGFGGGGGGAPSGVNVVGRPGGSGGSGSPYSLPCNSGVRAGQGIPPSGSISISQSAAGLGGSGGAGGCGSDFDTLGFSGAGGYMLLTW